MPTTFRSCQSGMSSTRSARRESESGKRMSYGRRLAHPVSGELLSCRARSRSLSATPNELMNDMSGVIQTWLMRAIFWCAFSAVASNPSISFGAAMAQSHRGDSEPGATKLSFLSRPERETPPGADAPSSVPPQDARNFDGLWTFTSAGCPYTGSLPARIAGGRIIIRGGSGQVDPDGTLHSVGAGNGMTLTAVGQLSGNTGSGTFNRSDGCIGHWIAIKRNGRRP